VPNLRQPPVQALAACISMSFFFVYSYSHVTYVDHGGVHLTQFSYPQSAR